MSSVLRSAVISVGVTMSNSFLYFAYGSNLLKKRIHINNPSAEFIGIGRLENHQLDFIKYSENWRGTSATIVPTTGAHVWGAVWRIDKKDLPALDRQEGVDANWYFPKTVIVSTLENDKIECRTYQQTVNPPVRKPHDDIPHERRPSITYLNCILKGAIQCQLPDYYVQMLMKINHNGMEASPKMIEHLEEPSKVVLETLDDLEEETFFYFAYGPNLLEKIIRRENKSATFFSIGRLDNYRLDFIRFNQFWNGPTFTMVPTANAHIWGAIYKLRKSDVITLDNHKGVDITKYYQKVVIVHTPYMGDFECRVYEQRRNALPRGDNDDIPLNQWPSKTYMEVVIQGAIQRGLPEYYINMLKNIKHNGQEGCLRMDELLRRYMPPPTCKCVWPYRIHRKPLRLDLRTIDFSKTKKQPTANKKQTTNKRREY